MVPVILPALVPIYIVLLLALRWARAASSRAPVSAD
jgi:hypothetical protein